MKSTTGSNMLWFLGILASLGISSLVLLYDSNREIKPAHQQLKVLDSIFKLRTIQDSIMHARTLAMEQRLDSIKRIKSVKADGKTYDFEGLIVLYSDLRKKQYATKDSLEYYKSLVIKYQTSEKEVIEKLKKLHVQARDIVLQAKKGLPETKKDTSNIHQ
jgi:hypothetical protein